jgi:hypothetical protein
MNQSNDKNVSDAPPILLIGIKISVKVLGKLDENEIEVVSNWK